VNGHDPMLPDTGHMVHTKRPEVVADAVRFLVNQIAGQ
jgi:pimeloyl-ACP methyl ester carboxylesterase